MAIQKNKLIVIDSDSDKNSEAFEELSNVLAGCNGSLRKKICDNYGFRILLDGEKMLLSHDGQKVGFGNIIVDGCNYSFEVFPKSSGLKISELSNYFDDGLEKTYGKVYNYVQQGVQGLSSDYSFAYLIGLLREISDFGVHFFNIYSSRTRITSLGKPIGRVVPESFVKNQLLGKFGRYECDILDNSKLRLFATVFYHTALSIGDDLKKWGQGRTLTGFSLETSKKIVTAKLRPYAVDNFSYRMLVQLSKPPFPFGLKELFFKCLKYWKNRGGLASTDDGPSMSYSGFCIRLDYLFEDYVGLLFKKALGHEIEHLDQKSFDYASELNITRQIQPDHIFVDHQKKRITIVEAKYSNKIAVRDHVAQLIAYLNFNSYAWAGYDKIGVLVYPGATPKCTKLSSFSSKVHIANVTTSLENCMDVIYSNFGL